MDSIKSTLLYHDFVFIVGYIKFPIYIVANDESKFMPICFIRNM